MRESASTDSKLQRHTIENAAPREVLPVEGVNHSIVVRKENRVAGDCRAPEVGLADVAPNYGR
jgi:hypothetical protein